MKIIIEHIIKFDNSGGWGDILLDIYKDQKLIQKQNQQIMLTQTELVQGLKDVTAQVEKVKGESSATLQKVTDLENALNNQGNVSPEVEDAFNALKQQVKVVDDLIADTPTPGTGEEGPISPNPGGDTGGGPTQ